MENNESGQAVSSVALKSFDEDTPRADAKDTGSTPAKVSTDNANVDGDGQIKAEEGLARVRNSPVEDTGSNDSAAASVNKASTTNAASAGASQSYVPPVKRFSSVNINKKFLQKNHTASASGTGISTTSSSGKQAAAIARPSPQAPQTHSRLITTKLTASPIPSSTTTGPGWSRPNSVTPPAPSPINGPGSAKSTTPTIASVGGPPQVTPGGKIIHPQVLKQKVDGPGKPAWKSVQPSVASHTLQAQNDFPTAAEAAQGRRQKAAETKAASDALDAQRQAMSETADAFRGVHLDPNAHHWDDMEEDDNDDFLGGVIEFGDGRQYKIQVSDGGKGESKPHEDSGGEVVVSKQDRFVDDFDRSWPKSRPEQNSESGRLSRASEASSNFSVHSPVSNRDTAHNKLLFNERSNRMEPFSGAKANNGTNGPFNPSHVQMRGSVRRTGPETSTAGPRYDREPHNHESTTHHETWKRPSFERGTQQQDHRPRREWSTSSTHSGSVANGYAASVRDRSVSQDGSRSERTSNVGGTWQRAPSRDRFRRPSSNVSDEPDFRGRVPHQPAADPHSTQEALQTNTQSSPTTVFSNLREPYMSLHSSNATGEDVEALRKAFLADSAERAKKRRQLEEEERARAQERARKKAAELEAMITGPKETESKGKGQLEMPATTSAPFDTDTKVSEDEVLNIIEDAVKSANLSDPVVKTNQPKPQLAREKDTQPLPTKAGTRSVSDTVDSWRSRAKPPVEVAKKEPSRESTIPSAPSLELQADEGTEVIDFSNMSQLVGDKDSEKPVASSSNSSLRSKRAVASDFFDDNDAERPESDHWKRTNTQLLRSHPATTTAYSGDREVSEDVSGSKTGTGSPGRTPSQYVPHGIPNLAGHTPQSQGSRYSRTPNASYKEAPLSALDDTMSRIKGALDGMHQKSDNTTKENVRESSHATPQLQVQSSTDSGQTTNSTHLKADKWLPPALRPQGAEHNHRRTEVFEVTRFELPISPAPRDNKFVIHLPKGCRRISPLTGRQANYQNKIFYGPVRWEILSFDPPVEGMTKRSLSVNDVLFGKPQSYRTRKFTVLLPKSSISQARTVVDSKENSSSANQKDSGIGAFGRPKMSAQASWRTPGTKEINLTSDPQNEEKLDVTSRSPPPEASTPSQKTPSQGETGQITTNSVQIAKGKHLPKASVADNVTFYCDSGKRTTSLTISFTVDSEIDDELTNPPTEVTTSSIEVDHSKNDTASFVTSEPITVSSTLPASVGFVLTSPKTQLESLTATELVESEPVETQRPLTPPPQNVSSSWTKSPARVPDPEVLKAVWSQASPKEALPPVNSLKGIADDLTSVPFSLHEVKSEGGTPPPHGPAAPTRMSAIEVTRAFQTVPTGPSNSLTSSLHSGFSSSMDSPVSTHRVLKPSSIGHPPTGHQNAGRPPYMSYPSPMSNHSPSPTLVYSHIVPNGMAPGPTASSYSQPMWMHQQAPQMLRAQPPSPYSPSLMPYHIQPTQGNVGMYSHPHQNGLTNSQNPHGSPASYPSAPLPQMVSPVAPPAQPVHPHMMYPGSPMLVHVPPAGGGSIPRTYPTPGVVGMGRGAPTPMDAHARPGPQPAPSGPPTGPVSRFPVHTTPQYSHAPPQPYVRPYAW